MNRHFHALTRRRFLQVAGGALGAIGLNNLLLSRQGNIYGRSLAQSTSRKVALLVGINDYSRSRLGGAVNDVELQKQLLIHRFGFASADVHVLQEEQASREDILGAFKEYLYEPARAGDVAVFHFSGHGDRVRESEVMINSLGQSTLSCIDPQGDCFNTAIAPHRYDQNNDNTVQDIMGHTLLLMRTALAQKTENVTFVLDCCFAGGGSRKGNAIMRSLHDSTPALALNKQNTLPQVSDREWDTQLAWMDYLGWRVDDFVAAITSSTAPGFFVGAADPFQLAADYSFDGLVAGAFTYLLTQYLWQETSSLSKTIYNVTRSSTRLNEHSQTPEFDPKPSVSRAVEQVPIYHISPTAEPAEAIVLELDPDDGSRQTWRLWLGGLEPQLLETFNQGVIFSVIDREGNALGEIHQVDGSRRGVMALGRLPEGSSLAGRDLSGQLLREKRRGIPDNVVLKIALDNTLSATEIDKAKTILARSRNFEVFEAQLGKAAHVMLGRYTAEIHSLLLEGDIAPDVVQTINSLGLFSPDQVPMLSGSFGSADETVEEAIGRLRSRLTSLHAGRMLALMVNGGASQLDMGVEIEHGRSRSGVTTRGNDAPSVIVPEQSARGIEQVPVGDRILLTVQNNEAVDLHFGILAINAAGQVDVVFPPPSDDLTLDVIGAGHSKQLPLNAVPPYGVADLLVLASPQSLLGPLKTLRDNLPRVGDAPTRGDDVDAVAVMTDLFGAMDTRRGGGADVIEGTRLLDVEDVAVLSLLFEILPPSN